MSTRNSSRLKASRKRNLSQLSQVSSEWEKSAKEVLECAKRNDDDDEVLLNVGPPRKKRWNPRIFDVRFHVKCALSDDDCEVSSVKNMLAMHSDIFDAMFFGDFAESKQSLDGSSVVEVTDCSKEAMNAINAYVFHCLDSVILNTENIGAVLYASTKYGIEGLKKGCEIYLKSALKPRVPEYLVKILLSLDTWQMHDASDSVIRKMSGETLRGVFNCELTITAPMPPRALLQMVEVMSGVRTEDIFKVVLKWAKEQTETRSTGAVYMGLDESSTSVAAANSTAEIMAPFIPHLNCAAMDFRFFGTEVCAIEGLLTAEQKADIFEKIAAKAPRSRRVSSPPLMCLSDIIADEWAKSNL